MKAHNKAITLDEFLASMQHMNESDNYRTVKKTDGKSTNHTIAIILLSILVVALGAMSIVLKTELASLKFEMAELKNIKSEVFTVDYKSKISRMESKIEEAMKDEQMLINNITKVRNDVDELKALLSKREDLRSIKKVRAGERRS